MYCLVLLQLRFFQIWVFEVIKVGKPGGDDSRNFGPFVKGKSSYFISLNKGKKSIVLDLKDNKEKTYFKNY